MIKKTLVTISVIAGLGVGLALPHAYASNTTTTTTTETTQVGTKTAGDLFLETNKKKPGVVTLADGLQYKILTKGKGASPTDNDTVTVDYAGTLVDGTEFDSSYKRGQPTSFPVSGVIAGWSEALKLMNTDATWELYIPAALAYGQEGAPPSIGPNQVLIFKVHLISFNKA